VSVKTRQTADGDALTVATGKHIKYSVGHLVNCELRSLFNYLARYVISIYGPTRFTKKRIFFVAYCFKQRLNY